MSRSVATGGKKVMDKELFTAILNAILRNNEGYYMETLQTLIQTCPKIFRNAVLSSGGKIRIYDMTSFDNEYTFTITVKWPQENLIVAPTTPMFIIRIDITDMNEIAPYVLGHCTDKFIVDFIKKKTGVCEMKKGRKWFDKIVAKAKRMSITVSYDYPFASPEKKILDDFQEFFGNILRRMNGQ